MNILLDTQIAIRWQIEPARIAPQLEALIMEQASAVWISRASLWEMAVKIGLGKLRIDLPRFTRQIEQDGFRLLGIETAHILALLSLPRFPDHKDPFDRLLVAQSLHEPLTLVTADAKLARYGPTVKTV
ncbi:MAG: type II toxin-antitoxin system VapC family toxin [Gammaproteobacteria bacterium]